MHKALCSTGRKTDCITEGRQPNRRWHSPVTIAPNARNILRRRAVSSGVRGAECMRCRREAANLISLKPRWRFKVNWPAGPREGGLGHAYFADMGKVGRPAGRNSSTRPGAEQLLPTPQGKIPSPHKSSAPIGCAAFFYPYSSSVLVQAMHRSSNCFWSTTSGQAIIRSEAFCTLGKAITSRMEVAPAISMHSRSRP